MADHKEATERVYQRLRVEGRADKATAQRIAQSTSDRVKRGHDNGTITPPKTKGVHD